MADCILPERWAQAKVWAEKDKRYVELKRKQEYIHALLAQNGIVLKELIDAMDGIVQEYVDNNPEWDDDERNKYIEKFKAKYNKV